MKSAPVLALVTDAFGGTGGIAQYNRDLLTALAPRHEIYVLPRCMPRSVEDLPSGVWQHRNAAGKITYIAKAVALAWRLKPRIIFCGHMFMAPLAALLSRMTGARLIVQFHGIETWQRPNGLCREAIEMADLALCVSRDTRARVLDWSAISPERVVVLPNMVGETFRPGDRKAARKCLGIATEEVILSVGRLDARERYKGHDRIIGALPELVAQGRDLIYLIAGDGDDRARLEALAAEYDISSRVRFLGFVKKEALPDLYRSANLFVLPSTGEGFGIVFLEALACGTPVLGFAKGGAKDILSKGGLATDPTMDNLGAEIARALDTARSASPTSISEAVFQRFGASPFSERANALTDLFAA